MKLNSIKMLANSVRLIALSLSILLCSSFHVFAYERAELNDGIPIKVSGRLMFIPSRFILYAEESFRGGSITFWSRPNSEQMGVEFIAIYPISESAKIYWNKDASPEAQTCGFKYKVKIEKVTDTPIVTIQLQVSLGSAFLIVFTPNKRYVDQVLKMLCDFEIDNASKAD